MKSMFLETIKSKSIQRRFEDILKESLKRKFIDFNLSRCDSVIQFGLTISFSGPDEELVKVGCGKYECYSVYVSIDCGWFSFGISIMDYN